MSTSTTTVSERDLIMFKLRLRTLGIEMTDSEVEAMKALLLVEHASPVREDGYSSGKKWVLSLQKRQAVQH